VSDCVFAAAAAVAVCPVCSPSSRCGFFVAGAVAAPAPRMLIKTAAFSWLARGVDGGVVWVVRCRVGEAGGGARWGGQCA
jgi:hypothetical protein